MSKVGQNHRIKIDVLQLIAHKFEVTLEDDDYSKFTVKFHGPKSTPYEGGMWLVRVVLVDNYPFTSPMVCFETPIFHPNIDNTSGFICLDVINQQWTPLYDLVAVFETFLPVLLTHPNPHDPLNNSAAIALRKNPHKYNLTIADYVLKYANPKKMEEKGKCGRIDHDSETSDLSEDETTD